MAITQLKTKETSASVEDFLNGIADEDRRADSFEVLDIFKRVTGEEPKMWGPSIVGFGSRVLKYESGRELDWMLTGFSPRKGNLTLYIMDGFTRYDDLMSRLGKHKTGKSCLYVQKLSDIDQGVLEDLISESLTNIRKSS